MLAQKDFFPEDIKSLQLILNTWEHILHMLFKWWWKTQNTVSLISDSLLMLKNHLPSRSTSSYHKSWGRFYGCTQVYELWVVWEVLATWICTSWLIDSPNGHHPQHSSFHLPKTSKEHKSCCWLRDPTSTTTMDLCVQRKFLQLPQGWTKTCEFTHSNFYQTTWTIQ